MGIPDAHARIQAPGGNLLAIKSNGVNLTEMPGQCPQTLSTLDTPDLGCGIVATRDDEVAVDFETTDAGLMSVQNSLQLSGHEVPDAEGRITGAGYCCPGIRHLQAAYGRGVAAESVNACPGKD